MKRLTYLPGLKTFQVNEFQVGPETDSEGNSVAHFYIPPNFLPIAFGGKIGTILVPSNDSNSENLNQTISVTNRTNERLNVYSWTGWSADVGSLEFTTPEIRITTDNVAEDIPNEGFHIVKENDDGSFIIHPNSRIFIYGIETELSEEH